MTDMSVGQVILFLTTLTGFAVQIYRENRKRTWDKQDRVRDRADRAEDAEALAAQVKSAADGLKEKVRSQHQEVIGEIKANTQVSVEAFTEANGVNAKILDLHQQIYKLQQSRPPRATDHQIDAIDARTAQHSEQLSDIQRKVDHE